MLSACYYIIAFHNGLFDWIMFNIEIPSTCLHYSSGNILFITPLFKYIQ